MPKIIFFLFLTLDKALRNSNPGEFAYIQQSKQVGKITMKIKTANSVFKGSFTCYRHYLKVPNYLSHR